jgi:hypothetical protein
MARVRSPNYPGLSLPEAISRVKSIHDAEQHLAAPREVIAKHLGYGGLNGSALMSISALNKYGLIEEANGDKVRVSQLAVTILYPPSSSARAAAIKEAASKPALFEEIANEWEGQRPSDENLRSYLVHRNFAVDAIDRVIKSYRETMDLVTRESGAYDSPKVDASAQHEEKKTMPPQVQHRTEHQSVPSTTPYRVTFTDGAIEVAGRLTSAKSVRRLIKALEAGETLLEMTGDDEDDEQKEAAN